MLQVVLTVISLAVFLTFVALNTFSKHITLVSIAHEREDKGLFKLKGMLEGHKYQIAVKIVQSIDC